MRLMRNQGDGKGKYAVIDLRTGEVVGRCGAGERNEFFVVMLKDRFARPALEAYAHAAAIAGQAEYARDVHELAERSGDRHPDCKDPD